MEISKENMFKKQYSSLIGQTLKKFALTNEKTNTIKKGKVGKIKKFIKTNKIITLTIAIFLICVSFNFILIYNFVKIAQNI